MVVLSFMMARSAIRLIDLPLKSSALRGGPAQGWGRSAPRITFSALKCTLSAAEAAGALRPPPWCSPEGGHLGAADWRACWRWRAAGALVGLPVLAGDVGVGGDGTLGGGHQRVGLQAHLGGEGAGALGLALEPGDRRRSSSRSSFWDAMVRSRAWVTLVP